MVRADYLYIYSTPVTSYQWMDDGSETRGGNLLTLYCRVELVTFDV